METSAVPSRNRGRAALIATAAAVPAGAVLSYLLFGWCAGIGAAVMEDEIYFALRSRMLGYGAVSALLPAAIAGILNHTRPLAVVLFAHVAGVAGAAAMAMCHFRWQIVMSAYLSAQFILPLVMLVMTVEHGRTPNRWTT